ncbi:RNI-like protein [Gigaspora margarita]|uniref:RNI-like protein n=1 Tax=Gigaspora margarita TaxID=4874 RepID=A0A8H4AEM5_GIGMA|nr:RNI-like protein [Gigaspora margarita]
MLSLPNECSLEIFNYLQFETLFSCLLVNRQWFRFIAPILWSEPLNHFSDARIISIYLSLLNAEEQASLIPFEIILPNRPKPLINYANFIVSYKDFNYDNPIKNWIANEGRGTPESTNYDDDYEDYDDNNYIVQIIKCSLIAMLIRTSKRLKFVTFHGHDYGIFAKNLIEAIYRNTTINDICLDDVDLGSDDVKAITDALFKNTTLESLNNELGAEGMELLAVALCKNTSLATLELSKNQLGIEGGKALANALCNNISLKSLIVVDNEFGLEGIEKLAKSLCVNSTLTTLTIHYNLINVDGGKALAQALITNTSLTSLDISICPLDGEDVIKEIAKALHKNVTLTSMTIYYEDDSEFGDIDGSVFDKVDDMLEKIKKKIRKDIQIDLQYES